MYHVRYCDQQYSQSIGHMGESTHQYDLHYILDHCITGTCGTNISTLTILPGPNSACCSNSTKTAVLCFIEYIYHIFIDVYGSYM